MTENDGSAPRLLSPPIVVGPMGRAPRRPWLEIRIVTQGLNWRIVGAVSAWFVPGRVAVTMGRTVYAYVSPLPPGVLDHERIHILQFQREGFRMWPKYMWFFVRNWLRFRDRRTAYLENPYEVEARGESRTV